jgi:PAS domain S-box-containing protein
MTRDRKPGGGQGEGSGLQPGTGAPTAGELPHSLEEALSSLERLAPSSAVEAAAPAERRLGLAVVTAPGDRFLQVDPGVTEITGFTREELHQLTLTDISYAGDLDDDDSSPSLFVAGELPVYVSERRLVRRDGALRWVRLHKTVLVGLGDGEAGPVGICIVEELPTDRRSHAPPPDGRDTDSTPEPSPAVALLERTQAELRAVLKRATERAEAERASVAAVLHDNVVKRLDALAAQLDPAKTAPGATQASDPIAAHRARLVDARRQALALAESVRMLLSRLRPPLLDERGLLAALRAYGERYARSTSVAVVVDGSEPGPRLGLQREIALYRIVEEAFTTVVAHDGATRVHVRLGGRDDRVVLTVTDDGLGREPEQADLTEQGLVTMREIAVAAGGLLRVEPAPGHGTQISVELPRG